MASRKESRILRTTYNFYKHKLSQLSPDEYALIGTEMEKAHMALEKLDTKECVEIFVQIFEIVDEHGFIDEQLVYPGPQVFHQLVDYV